MGSEQWESSVEEERESRIQPRVLGMMKSNGRGGAEGRRTGAVQLRAARCH